MPRYCYICAKCKKEYTIKHSYKAEPGNCPGCGSPDLVRQITSPATIKYRGSNYPQRSRSKKTGSVVNSTIEETKQEIKKQQTEFKKREIK